MAVARDQAAEHGDTARFLRIVQADDRTALEALLQAYRPQCLRQAQRILGSAADAEDAVQNAYVRLMHEAARYDGQVAFGAWLGRLVQAAAIDLRRSTRRLRRREHVAGHLPRPTAADPDDDEAIEQVRRLVATLPAELQSALSLRYVDGLSQREAAARLGISENLIAVRVHRAKQELRRRLQQVGVAISLPGVDRRLAAIGMLGHATTSVTAWSLRTVLVVCAGAVTAGLLIGGLWRLRVVHPTPMPAPAPLVVAARPEEPVPVRPPAAVPAHPAAAVAARTPRQVYTWHFDDGPPQDIRVIEGSWHFEPHAGVGGSGCMEVDTDTFFAIIDRPVLPGPLKATIKVCPRLPAQDDYQVKVMWDTANYQYQLENIGPPPVRIPMDARHDNTRFLPVWAYLSDDSVDQYSRAGRSHLDFMRPTPGAPLKLGTIHHVRLDDLVIEQIDPSELPDLTALRQAVYQVPREARQGTTDLPGVRGFDPRHPVRVEWGYPPLQTPPLVP